MSNNDDCPEPLETNMNKSSKFLLWSKKPQQNSFGIENPIWKMKAYKIIYLVARFLSIITKHIVRNDLIHLTKSDFNLIHDSSSDYNYYRYRGYFPKDKPTFLLVKLNYWFSCILQRESQYIQQNHKKWLLKPDDTIMIAWNIYLILIVTVNVFYVSLRISFNEIMSLNMPNKDFLFEQLPVYSYLLEIILKFNTCIYYKGNLITNRIKIIKNYCTNDLLIDAFLVGPFFVGQLFDFRYFDFVIILKVFQLSSLFSSLFNRLELSPRQTAVFDLFKLVSFMILVAHFSACIWHIIGQWGEWGNGSDKTWLKVANLQHESWVDRYVVSFYWSIVTMTTIGYGDITPVNLTERIFVIFMTMISSATFAYTVNNIGGIFQDFSKQSVQLKNNMNQLNRFLRSQNVSIDLQIKFRRYFEYLWSKPSQKVSQFSELIPKSLKDQMIVDVNLKILNQIQFFKNFSQQFLHKLCMHFEEKNLQSEDYLFTRNKNSQFLYILVTGEIRLVLSIKNKQRLLQKIDSPQFIGQLDYFTNQSYTFDAVASKTTKILQISRENLYFVFKDYPLDYEVYQQLKDDVIDNQDYSQISIQCNTCQSQKHYINKCPFLFGLPSKFKALYNHRKGIPVERVQNFRRHNHQRKMYALKHHFIVMESVINFMMKNEDVVHIEGLKELQQGQANQNQTAQTPTPVGLYAHQRSDSAHPSFNQLNKLQPQLSSQRFFNSGNLLPPSEDSPRTCRLMQNAEAALKNETKRQFLRKLSFNFNNQIEEQNVAEEVPTSDKIAQKLNINESLDVANEQQQLQKQCFSKKQFAQQLQIPQLEMSQINGNKNRLRGKQDQESSSDEGCERETKKKMTEIFNNFERVKEYVHFHPQNNVSIVLTKYLEKRVVFLRQTKKRKSRRQETLLHILKQAQGKQRL